jgi:hypothetical protein
MSFLRHKEIYPCDEGRDLATAPPLIAVDEPPAGYSWQVALQQSPLPLHQPELYCQSSTAPDNASAANGEMSLNWLSQPRGPLHFSVTGNLKLLRARSPLRGDHQ